ncbi:hypothetical protein JXI42_08685 [bacterium]|nr:hypothetical protein [bacterium]
MKKLISFKFAAKASLVIYGLFILFHFAIILGILFFNFVPIDYLWGGRMQTGEQLLVFEIISLLVQIICMFLTLIKAGYFKIPRMAIIAHVGMWILFALFLLNTIGNIFAKTVFEKSLAIVTAALAVFALRLALEKKRVNT